MNWAGYDNAKRHPAIGVASRFAMTNAIDLILFDCDGVLVDSERISASCVAEALRDAGYPTDDASILERFMGMSNPAMCNIIEHEMGRPLPINFIGNLSQRIIEVSEVELQPIAGVAEAVDQLDAPYCVASSSHPNRVRRSLEIAGLIDRLGQYIFSASMVERGKPAPDLFQYASDTIGARPDRCVVVEDSEAGVRAGKAAGMFVLGFTGGSHVTSTFHGPKLAAAGADVVFSAMAELPDLLNRCVTERSRPNWLPSSAR